MYGYQLGGQAGVYHSHNPILAHLPVVVLNELSDEPHNAFVKCFASRSGERQRAFARLYQWEMMALPQSWWWFVSGLRQVMQVKGANETMKLEVTAEDVLNLGEELKTKLLESIPPEEVLAQYQPYIQEARRQTVLEGLQRLLTVRFQLSLDEAAPLMAQFQPFDLETLEALTEVGLRVETVAGLEQTVADLPPSEEENRGSVTDE